MGTPLHRPFRTSLTEQEIPRHRFHPRISRMEQATLRPPSRPPAISWMGPEIHRHRFHLRISRMAQVIHRHPSRLRHTSSKARP